jgi:subtilisin family serine protease
MKNNKLQWTLGALLVAGCGGSSGGAGEAAPVILAQVSDCDPSAAPSQKSAQLLVQPRAGEGVAGGRPISGSEFWVLEVPGTDVEGSREAALKSGKYHEVEVNAEAQGGDHGSVTPTDPLYSQQWHLSKIGAEQAWFTTSGSSMARIAILDSGVDASHPDLAGRLEPGWNFLTGTSDTSDILGHGTSVAGVAGASAFNGNGGAGVAWSSPLVPYVVLDSSNSARYSDIVAAITRAADQGIRIINISIGGKSPSKALQNAVNYAWSKGSIVVAAAMNDGNSTKSYPAACDKVVSVGATDWNDDRVEFSNYGPWLTLVAPGRYIACPMRGG